MLAHSFLNESSSKLLVTRTGIKAWASLISGPSWNFFNFWTIMNCLMRFSLLCSGASAWAFYRWIFIYIGVSLNLLFQHSSCDEASRELKFAFCRILPMTKMNVEQSNGPRQANLVLIAYASSEGSGEPAHPRSLARTSAARSYKQWVKRNLQTERKIPGPSEWLGMRSYNLSWRNARRHKFAWWGSNINSYIYTLVLEHFCATIVNVWCNVWKICGEEKLTIMLNSHHHEHNVAQANCPFTYDVVFVQCCMTH